MEREEYNHPMTTFTGVPVPASFQSVGRSTHYILPSVSHLADVQNMALCKQHMHKCRSDTARNSCAAIVSSPKAHLAQGTIFLASLWLMQNPAPPVANQKRTDFWRETPHKNQWQRLRQYHTPRDGNAGKLALMSGQTQPCCHPDCCPEDGTCQQHSMDFHLLITA